jgi:hypothetical protein
MQCQVHDSWNLDQASWTGPESTSQHVAFNLGLSRDTASSLARAIRQITTGPNEVTRFVACVGLERYSGLQAPCSFVTLVLQQSAVPISHALVVDGVCCPSRQILSIGQEVAGRM